MKLSIWQQFSSNHSNEFTIVGHFKTAADAESAAEEIRAIIRKIRAWSEAHPDEPPRYENRKYIPNDLEQQIGAQYGVEWRGDHEWIVMNTAPEKAVRTFGQYMFVEEHNTWAGYEPFNEILKKMGAEVVNAEQEMGEMFIFVNVSATAPDTQIAKTLADKIQKYLDASSIYWKSGGAYLDSAAQRPILPWVFHDVDRPSATEETILQAEELGRIDSRNLENLREAWRQLIRINLSDDDPQVKAAKQAIDDYQSLASNDQQALIFWLHDALLRTKFSIYSRDKKVTVNAAAIQFDNLRFHHLARGLTALVSWLRAEGCEVSWEFREDTYPEWD